jgi:hypothetical protein
MSLRVALLFLAFLGVGTWAHAGVASYTERGQTDFDTVLKLLNPYGTWSKVDDLWAYTPLDHAVPYTNGRWIYTEFGWYWKGNAAHSWVTEHYGYWKRGADKVWAWYPGPVWLPQIVEIRATKTHIGWRSAAVDADGNFLEQPIDRYGKTDEWTFVTRAQFAGPITPSIVAKPDEVETQLEDSTDSLHGYLTYRVIDRPGPHPADFMAFATEGGMFPALTAEDIAAVPPAPSAKIPGYTPATNAPASIVGANGNGIVGTDTEPVDKRQVKYWVTMSLPSFWAKPPPDANANEMYVYHPDFYQDQDGIERRISLWFNPNTRTSLREVLGQAAAVTTPPTAVATGAPATPAVPAVPAQAPTHAHDPFRSPFEDSFRPGSTNHGESTSTKAPAPSGTATPATNAAP